jgi:hypothetical protein
MSASPWRTPKFQWSQTPMDMPSAGKTHGKSEATKTLTRTRPRHTTIVTTPSIHRPLRSAIAMRRGAFPQQRRWEVSSEDRPIDGLMLDGGNHGHAHDDFSQDALSPPSSSQIHRARTEPGQVFKGRDDEENGDRERREARDACRSTMLPKGSNHQADQPRQ